MDWLSSTIARNPFSYKSLVSPTYSVAQVAPEVPIIPIFTILGHFRQSSLPSKGIDGFFRARANRYHSEGSFIQIPNGPCVYFVNRDNMPGRNACMIISGYTAWAMLIGQMNTPDDLHRAMLRGISRYQDIARAFQNSDDDPLKAHLMAHSGGDGRLNPVRDGDLFYAFHLHALDGLIQIDPRPGPMDSQFQIPHNSWHDILFWIETTRPSQNERVAAVITKGPSTFSVMMEPNGRVQITDSHPISGENCVAFSKKFHTLHDAAQFLSTRYPYLPPKNPQATVDPANQVECTPIFLPVQVVGNPQTIESFDSHYASECWPLIQYFSPQKY